MSDINMACITGRISTRDPELKAFANSKLCKFTLSTRYYKGGGKDEGISFIDCKAWNKCGEIIAQYMRKGSNITVSGQIRQERWKDKEGKNRSNVVLYVDSFKFGSKNESETNSSATPTTPEEKFDDDSHFEGE